MTLQSQRELEATREKLRLLEQRYDANKREQGGDEHVRELSMGWKWGVVRFRERIG